ncbi:unnamed protein product [Durusdinium trenchii]|uniref:K Homology domain-containing protein n=2 Tax=Durusdinium trenchii TaxID=1381693 RepID=A0ABP0MN73_9DINO
MVAPRSLALVEVAKREGGPWYEAILRDLQLDKAWVAFDKGVWPSREVPCSHVRPRAKSAAGTSFVENAEVEVRLATSECPACWCQAWMVAHEESGEVARCYVSGQGEVTVPIEAIRAKSQEMSLNPLAFTRVAVEVEPALRKWLSLSDCRGCLEQIRSLSALHLATPGVQSPSGGNGVVVQELDSIILLGSEEATQKAQMVVKIHLQHQAEVEAFHRRRNKKLALLKELEAKSSGEAAAAVLEVASGLVGRTCGRGGERVQRLEKEFAVEIRLAGDDDAPWKTFLIYGAEEDAAAAREALELKSVEYPLSESSLAWFRKDNRILLDIAKKAQLAAATLQDGGLELLGSSSALEDAKLLLENHLEYLPVYEEMDRQQEEIQKSFEALERSKPKWSNPSSAPRAAPRASKGKAGGKGARGTSRGRPVGAAG